MSNNDEGVSLSREEFEIILSKWLDRHGVQKVSKKGNYYIAVPRDRVQRIEVYHILIRTLIENYGFKEKDLRSQLFTNMVVNVSVNLNHPKKNELNEAKKHAKEHWYSAINLEFQMDFVDPSVSKEKLKQLEESRKEEKIVAIVKPKENTIDLGYVEFDRSKHPNLPKPSTVIDDSIDIFGSDEEGT